MNDDSDIDHLQVVYAEDTMYEDVEFQGQYGTLKLTDSRLIFHASEGGSSLIPFANVIKIQHHLINHLIKLVLRSGTDALFKITDRVTLVIIRDDLKERLQTWGEGALEAHKGRNTALQKESPAANSINSKASTQRQRNLYSHSNINSREEPLAKKTAQERAEEEAQRRAQEEATKKAQEEALARHRQHQQQHLQHHQDHLQQHLHNQQVAYEARRKNAEDQRKAAEEKDLGAQRAAVERKAAAQKREKEAKAAEAKKNQMQAKKQADQAHDKATEERLQKWKQQQKKRRQQQAAKNGGTPPVERVPKLSALLAMGGPGAEEYRKKQDLARLAKWKASGDKWKVLHQTYDGRSISEVTKEEVVKDISEEEALQQFHNNPEKYLALHYCPEKPEEFTFILRADTVGYEPQDVRDDASGDFVILRHLYQRLPPLKGNVLPKPYRDKFTDRMTFGGWKLHSRRNLPLLPGRGMGLGDEANMELMDFPQPGHVRQGASVGDCWLLSAIACLADFDWAVRRLFRKTKQRIQDCPRDPPNQYTVTLWDLKTWKEVDVVVDERLPVQADGSGHLLGARPSREGKFWVPYLEKAIAVHCGGYDKICGGNCTDAWPIMTGSRNQYVITKNPKTKKYQCGAKFNPQTKEWSQHSNSPHDSTPAIWKVDWPTVGGDDSGDIEINEDGLFQKIIAWDENNYLLGAGTSGESDKEKTDGIVDNHAYSIIDSRQNICGTGIDLLLIRNPWGEGGELENGQFMRTGPGWKRYPNIREELNPVMEDHGLCWVTRREFFQYFSTVYLCALNMTRLKDPSYSNDLQNQFKDRPKPVKKAPMPAKTTRTSTSGRIRIDKRPYRSSSYKLVEQSFNGGVAFCDINKQVVHGKSIAEGVNEFRSNPKKYLAIHWQKNIVEEGWPIEEHHYTIIYRDGTEGLEVGAVKGGARTILTNVLQ